ncbi:hypothetical protein EPUL_005274, partial [Erysiphe pulchra]
MINRIRREHGIASSIFELDYDLTDPSVVAFQYSEGRIVICYSGIIIVEDLNTRKKKILLYPQGTNHRKAKIPFLVGQYLISSITFSIIANLMYGFRMESNAQLVIWNVISLRKYFIPMSQVIYTATSYQNQVGLVVKDAADFGTKFFFFTWDEESGLKKVATLPEIEDPRVKHVNARIFFHPSKKGVVFITIQTRIFTKYDSSTYGTRIIVYCYNESRLVYAKEEIIKTTTVPGEYKTKKYNNDKQICFFTREPPFGWNHPNIKSKRFVRLPIFTNEGMEHRWLPVRRSRDETLLDQEQLLAVNEKSNVGRESHIRWIELPDGFVPLVEYKKSSNETFYEHLNYDMSTEKFIHFKAPLHPTYQECLFGHGCLIWNDQVLIRARHENTEKLQVITLSKGLSGLWNGSMQSNDSPHSSGSSIMRSETRSSCISSPFELQDGLHDNIDFKVYGDDNFVVLKADNKVKVWKFDEFKY